jgi:hypothetical protein
MATNLQDAQVLSDSSGADTAGPVSSSTVTIGGESFSVDPRGGSLNYSFTFFNGNVNYGQTPFNLSIQYQQNRTPTESAPICQPLNPRRRKAMGLS